MAKKGNADTSIMAGYNARMAQGESDGLALPPGDEGSVIRDEQTEIEDYSGQIEESLRLLTERIETILMPASPDPLEVPSSAPKGISVVAQRLHEHQMFLSVINTRLIELRNRVEL